MELEYLSVKEFAEEANVSVQSIYKRINKAEDPIHQFLKADEKTPMIAAAALEVIYNKSSKPLRSEKKSAEAAAADQMQKEYIELLKQQLEAAQNELQEKNKMIGELLEQAKIKEQTHTQIVQEFQQIINNQQMLTAADKSRVLALENAEDKKKGFFRFFGRKRKTEQGEPNNEQ